MPPDDHIQIPPESSAQISSNHPSVWQRYWYWIIGAIAIILVVVIVIFWNPFSNTKTGSQFRINPNLSDTPYASLYLCGQEIFSTVGIFATDKLDARSLTGDSLFILDGTNNLLYFYTSSYADKTHDISAELERQLQRRRAEAIIHHGLFQVSQKRNRIFQKLNPRVI